MREILFRGQRVVNKKWVEGYLFKQFNNSAGKDDYYIRRGDTDYLVIPETVGQFTGLTDKNGKKIFEGDIHEHNNERWYVRFSNFYDAELEDNFYGWHCVDNKGRAYGFNGTESLYMNIIGNIHDNPELLKGEQKCCGKNL